MSPVQPEVSRVATTWRKGWVQINLMVPPAMKPDIFLVAERSGAWSGQDWIRRVIAEAILAQEYLVEVSPLLASPTPGRWRHDGIMTEPAREILDDIRLDDAGT